MILRTKFKGFIDDFYVFSYFILCEISKRILFLYVMGKVDDEAIFLN